MSNFVIEIKGLNKLERAIRRSPRMVRQELSQAISTSLHLIRPIMKNEAPRGKTGNLRRNIKAHAQGLEGSVGPNLDITPYAYYVHEGTGPYEIRPKTKKALYWPGAKHPVRLVKHPGIKANPYVERTFKRIKQPVENVFNKQISNIIRKFHSS